MLSAFLGRGKGEEPPAWPPAPGSCGSPGLREGVVYCSSWPRARQQTPNEFKLQREVTNSSRGRRGFGRGSGAAGAGGMWSIPEELPRAGASCPRVPSWRQWFLSQCHQPWHPAWDVLCFQALENRPELGGLSLAGSGSVGAATAVSPQGTSGQALLPGCLFSSHPLFFPAPENPLRHPQRGAGRAGGRGRSRVHAASSSLALEPLGPGDARQLFPGSGRVVRSCFSGCCPASLSPSTPHPSPLRFRRLAVCFYRDRNK